MDISDPIGYATIAYLVLYFLKSIRKSTLTLSQRQAPEAVIFDGKLYIY